MFPAGYGRFKRFVWNDHISIHIIQHRSLPWNRHGGESCFANVVFTKSNPGEGRSCSGRQRRLTQVRHRSAASEGVDCLISSHTPATLRMKWHSTIAEICANFDPALACHWGSEILDLQKRKIIERRMKFWSKNNATGGLEPPTPRSWALWTSLCPTLHYWMLWSLKACLAWLRRAAIYQMRLSRATAWCN